MREVGNERLVLNYRQGTGDVQEHVLQSIYLTFTQPHLGGKRWWMLCPFSGQRVGKLYMPVNGDRFASRKAWRLGYQSQRVTDRDAIFGRLFRVQKKLGCEQGWGNFPLRPKGMHHRTYRRLLDEFEYLDNLCGVEMMRATGLLKALDGI